MFDLLVKNIVFIGFVFVISNNFAFTLSASNHMTNTTILQKLNITDSDKATKLPYSKTASPKLLFTTNHNHTTVTAPTISPKSNLTNHKPTKLNPTQRHFHNATKYSKPSSNKHNIGIETITPNLSNKPLKPRLNSTTHHLNKTETTLSTQLNIIHPNAAKSGNKNATTTPHLNITHPNTTTSSNANSTTTSSLTMSSSSTNTDGSLTLSELLLKESSYVTHSEPSSPVDSSTSSSNSNSTTNVSQFTQSLNEFAIALYGVKPTKQLFI